VIPNQDTASVDALSRGRSRSSGRLKPEVDVDVVVHPRGSEPSACSALVDADTGLWLERPRPPADGDELDAAGNTVVDDAAMQKVDRPDLVEGPVRRPDATRSTVDMRTSARFPEVAIGLEDRQAPGESALPRASMYSPTTSGRRRSGSSGMTGDRSQWRPSRGQLLW
jgi:hypothetical protein